MWPFFYSGHSSAFNLNEPGLFWNEVTYPEQKENKVYAYHHRCIRVIDTMTVNVRGESIEKVFKTDARLTLDFITYLVNIWGAAAECHLRPWKVLQNRALKILYKLPILTSSQQLVTKFGSGFSLWKDCINLQLWTMSGNPWSRKSTTMIPVYVIWYRASAPVSAIMLSFSSEESELTEESFV